MASLVTCLLLLCVLATIESRTLRLKNIPITPEGISLRILVKEDPKTGLPVATLKLAMGEGRKHATLAPPTETISTTEEITTKAVTTDDLPEKDEQTNEVELNEDESPSEVTFENRFGIGDAKCPKGRKRMGRLCHPIG